MWPNDGNPTNYYLSQLELLTGPTPRKKAKPISVGPTSAPRPNSVKAVNDNPWVDDQHVEYSYHHNTVSTPTIEGKFAQQGISLAEAQHFITSEVGRMASHMEQSFHEAYKSKMDEVIKELKLEMAVLQEQLDELSEAVNE